MSKPFKTCQKCQTMSKLLVQFGCFDPPSICSSTVHAILIYIWLVVWNMALIFPYVGNVIIPTVTHSIIFQRGRLAPTNQIWFVRHDSMTPWPRLGRWDHWGPRNWLHRYGLAFKDCHGQVIRLQSPVPADLKDPKGPQGTPRDQGKVLEGFLDHPWMICSDLDQSEAVSFGK